MECPEFPDAPESANPSPPPEQDSVPPPIDCRQAGYWAIWGSSAIDVYAAGTCGQLMHFNGADWQRIELDDSIHLFALWGSAHNDIFAAGERVRQRKTSTGDWMERRHGVILHYNGNAWFTVFEDTADGSAVFGIWGSAPGDVYAIGEQTAMQYNGNYWLRTDSLEKRAIWGSGPECLLAVGRDRAIVPQGEPWGAISKFDGTRWQVLLEDHSTREFRGIWGATPSDVFVVGADGVIGRFADEHWLKMASPMTESLNAVWGSANDTVFAVGEDGALARFDGTRWHRQSSGTTANLVGIWAAQGTMSTSSAVGKPTIRPRE